MALPKPPYLGASYYPEAWPADQMDHDIAMMVQAGMKVMRLADFAWSTIQPSEGRFEFDWLHRAVDRLAEAGIASILCTPTAAPPAWLTQAHPDVLVVSSTGKPLQHGGRRHACANSPTFREYTRRIVEEMARQFGSDPSVIGWQLDNEVYPKGSRGCCCQTCAAGFRAWLRDRLGSIEVLNEAWDTALWSQTYQSFEQIPVPLEGTWHNPSLLTAWMRFQGDSQIRYVAFQEGILRPHTRAPISTNMMYVNGVSYQAMAPHVDLIQHNNYHNMDNLWHEVFWADFCRPLKDRPFWIAETAACWNGTTSGERYKDEGFIQANSWLPIALGAEANIFWLWRTHYGGHELAHSAMLSAQGRPYHFFSQIRQVADGYARAAEFINSTTPAQSGLAVHFSSQAWWLFEFQPMVAGFRYLPRLLEDAYGPLIRGQLRPDVIDPAADLSKYKVVLSPYLPSLDEAGLPDRLLRWVQGGGTWIAGPLTDVRTAEAVRYLHSPFGHLESWAGVHSPFYIPGHPRTFAMRWADGRESKGSVWFDALEPRGCESLATYSEGPLSGLAAITRHRVGKGRIILLGTMPSGDDFARLAIDACTAAGIAPSTSASPNVLVVPRVARNDASQVQGLMIVEMANQPGQLTLPQPVTDLLTGRRLEGSVPVKPYEAMVLAY